MTGTLRDRTAWAARRLRSLARQAAPGSDLLLGAIADQLDEALFVVDAERNLLLFNRRAEEITGFARDEVLGRHCLSGIRCVRCLESCGVFTKGKVENVPLALTRRDGGKASIIKSASVIRDRRGAVLGAIEVFRLAPEEQQSCPDGEAGARSDEAAVGRLGTLLGALGRGFLVVDDTFVVRHVSEELASLAGSSPHLLVGSSASSLLGDLCAEVAPFRRSLEAGELREGYRASLRRVDGSTLGASVSGAPLDADLLCDGETTGASQYLLVVRPDGRRAGAPAADSGPTTFEGMVARSQQMRQIFQLIETLRESDATVLVTGESGTGKELVARAIHARSGRRDRPFVAVNCGALPGELLESELFGHARGSFTGAIRDKPGRFEVVEDGTILLDEIGDMPLPLQVKLLRVLQERTFERIGETTSRRVSARIVAATHQDLARLVAERRFREDLYYRLNVVPVRVPALRERREDIEPLVYHLLDEIGRRRSRTYRLSPGVLRALLAHDWPGNVRQLQNALEYATTVCEGETLHQGDLPPELAVPRQPRLAPSPPLPRAPRDAPSPVASTDGPPQAGGFPSTTDIENALRQARYKKGEAAKLLGISRTTLWRRMRELGLQ